MSRASNIIPFTTYCLLGLYITTLIGFITAGMIHTVEHVIAESRLPQVENSAFGKLPFREAGCKTSVDIASNTRKACPGCSKQQKGSAVMVKYYRVFNFHSYPTMAVLQVKKGTRRFLTHSDQNDQTSSQPLTPPPRRFSV